MAAKSKQPNKRNAKPQKGTADTLQEVAALLRRAQTKETMLTIQEVADMLKVSVRTVRRLIDNHKIKGLQVGRQWRFTESAVASYIAGDSVQ